MMNRRGLQVRDRANIIKVWPKQRLVLQYIVQMSMKICPNFREEKGPVQVLVLMKIINLTVIKWTLKLKQSSGITRNNMEKE